ncbi:hypothetical protein [Catenulispora pinisilvae]|uniref:hypothetical protein n=1 Tax=Catenulispora pinisilvae TaxID=2705253 RepID=UPI0018917B91|nr:hypothetical protein [Catenulispora pinisilvae]
MWSDIDDLMERLRTLRRTNTLQLEVMAQYFDFEGAMAAEQPELAWRAREGLLATGIELNLCAVRLAGPPLDDRAEQICALLQSLSQVSPALGATAADLLERPAPGALSAIGQDTAAVIAFVRDDLGVAGVDSRAQAMKAWADGVRHLRDLARVLGLAQADGWYLPADRPEGHLTWYDDVMNAIAQLHP